jgi:PPOX class probable F420-dependent enzyme
MGTDLIDTDTTFGQRVRERLTSEQVIWLTTVGQDGTPQPNPVWFVWDGGSELLVYTTSDAHRLEHIGERPRVSVHLNSDRNGMDVVVLRGVAEVARDVPTADRNERYLDKYRPSMANVGGSVERFAATYCVPLRIRLERLRGF